MTDVSTAGFINIDIRIILVFMYLVIGDYIASVNRMKVDADIIIFLYIVVPY